MKSELSLGRTSDYTPIEANRHSRELCNSYPKFVILKKLYLVIYSRRCGYVDGLMIQPYVPLDVGGGLKKSPLC